MDKEDSVNLDVEFNQYLQILKPYLGQLLNEVDVNICNTWIQKLSGCKNTEKYLRNKYIFSLCFQLAKGMLSFPFNDYPPSEELSMIYDKFNPEDYSDGDTHIMYIKNSNNEKFLIKNLSSKSICQPKKSDITISSSKIEMEDDIRDIKTFTRDFLSSSNSTIANCLQCPEIVKDLKNYVRSEDNVYLRVNNLVDKLREIKAQNTNLNEELQLLKKKSEINKIFDLPSTNNRLQIHCAVNTDNFNNDNKDLWHQCTCKTKVIELEEKLEELKESKAIEIAEQKLKHEKEIIHEKTFIRIEIQDQYEKQIQDLKEKHVKQVQDLKEKHEKQIQDLNEKHELKLQELKQNAENEINQIKFSFEALKLDKESSIAAKNKVIDDFRTELDEIKARNFILRNKFMRVNNDINLETIKEKSFQLERRLYKTEKSKNKRIRAYQIQLNNLQRDKNLLGTTMHLQLLKQRSELVLGLAEENQKELISTFDKLEEKYKEVVANVQAAAIQRKIEDQISLETIIKALYDNGDDLNGSLYEFQSGPTKNHHKNKKSPCSQYCKDGIQMDKKVFNVEDNFVPAFCLDEVKLSELFERVYITRNKISNEQFES